MKYPSRPALASAALVCLLQPAAAAFAGGDGAAANMTRSPSSEDLRDIYVAFVRDHGRPERCEYRAAWTKDDTTLIASAHRLWGSAAQVVLPSAQLRTDFRRTLDPDDKTAFAVCTREDDDRYTSRLLQKQNDNVDWQLRFNRVQMSWPVFSATRDKALFIEIDEISTYKHVRDHGTIETKTIGTGANIAAKSKDGWSVTIALGISYWPPKCASGQIMLRVHETRDSDYPLTYVMRNVGNAPCLTGGYPKLWVENEDHRRLPVDFASPYRFPVRIPVEPLWLAPGAEASGRLSGFDDEKPASSNCLTTAFLGLDFGEGTVRSPFVHRSCSAPGKPRSVLQTSMSLVPPPASPPRP